LNRIFGIALLGALLGGCAFAEVISNPATSPNWHPHDMTLAEYQAHLAWLRAHPEQYRPDNDGMDYSDKMDMISATHAPPCGICDPISRRSPDGTYTLPPQNR